MAGTFTDFWRIVKPAATKSHYVASSVEAAKLYSNVSWYTKVMKGAASRFSKYTQFKNMDSDVFVARALDTIAEEMVQKNAKTNLPFEIIYQNESNKEIPEAITMTVRAALRHWCDMQNFDNTLFDIGRTTIKFGDCFFKKSSDLKRWQYIEPGDVIGVSIGVEGEIEQYHIRVGEKNQLGAFGDVILVPAAGVVHFTLSSSMGDNGPFGESVLFPTVKAFRHLSLLEDSVIIYRIVRAPERRVFFIDTGNMPPQKVKAYLEAIKNEMRQKRIPNESGGTDKIDSIANPMCFSLDTMIPLLDGRVLQLQDIIREHEEGKQNWVYSCNSLTGEVVSGPVTWAGVTRRNAELVKVILDNGESVTVTPDHRFPILGGEKVRADQLTPDMSLISLEQRKNPVIRIINVEHLAHRADTGCLTVDGDHKYHAHHTVGLGVGIFACQSMIEDFFFAQTAEGRGSRVETLSGGESLGEIRDLAYFQAKFLQGLRIPSSYMRGGDDTGAAITDGKVGIAYIEEARFANYVVRLQTKLNSTFDDHFKAYLKSAGLKIDSNIFKIKLTDPQNFTTYKEAEVNEKLLNNYSSVKDIKSLSERYKLIHFLGLSEDDIQENEVLIKQERAIPDKLAPRLTDLRMIYDPAWIEKMPEIKISEDYENFEDVTSKKAPEDEVEEDKETDENSGEEAVDTEENKGGEGKETEDKGAVDDPGAALDELK